MVTKKIGRARNYDKWRKKSGFEGLTDRQIEAKIAEKEANKKPRQAKDTLQGLLKEKVNAYRAKLISEIDGKVELYRINLTKQLEETLNKIL